MKPNKKSIKKTFTKKNTKTLKNKTTRHKRIRGTRKNKKYGGNFDYTNNLTDTEINTLKKYTEGSDTLINKILRIENNYKDVYDTINELEVEDREQKLKEMNDFINIIDTIMISKATVAKEDLVVYRGTVNKKEEQPYLGMNKGYISTSKSINAIEKNSYRFLNEAEGCCVYIYTIKKGVPYINLSKISYFGERHQENQEEILLPRGLNSILTSVDESTKIHGSPYKTYNVTIELNNHDNPLKYDVEPIEKTPNISQMFEVFDIINIIPDLNRFLYNLTNYKNKNYNDEQRLIMSDIYDVDDFSEIINDVIDDILKSSHPLNDILHDYNEYMNDIIKQFMALDFIKDDDKVELQRIQREITTLYSSVEDKRNKNKNL